MFIDRMIDPVLGLPRIAKKAIALALDTGLCVLTVWLAISLRLSTWVTLSGYGWPAALASVAIALPTFTVFGLYRTVFRYVSWDELTNIGQAVFVYGIIYFAVFTAFSIPGIPRTVGIIQPILLLLVLVASRAMARFWLGGRLRQRLRRGPRKNVLIYGAGSAGRQLAGALADTHESRVVGFVDDAGDLQGSMIGRVPVLAPDRIADAVENLEVDEIFLAIPSAPQSRRNEIVKMVGSVGIGVKTLPGILDIANGKVSINQLRPLDVEDLLGRDPVPSDTRLLELNIHLQTVLVTGAGGSIGSELCRQILAMRPSRLMLVDSSEYALYGIHRELCRLGDDNGGAPVEIVPLLASVDDEERMRRIFAAWTPHTVYHAAAYKHVPLVEHNLVEGVRNNVLGTHVCAQLAREHKTGSFVLISTDKAVRPTNVMGASKRLAEMVLQALATQEGETRFSMVRFGNVLGSSGSVVPLFRQQIGYGGPVTVTHQEITRYFMTIPEAAQLVLHAGAMAQGGEVFVLDMGQPIRIVDLAVRMIELSGLTRRGEQSPDGDIEIVFTGLRPGEKLYEELLIGGNPSATTHPRIMKAEEAFIAYKELLGHLKRLRALIASQDAGEVRRLLSELVREYVPEAEIVDWLHRADAATAEAELPKGRRGALHVSR